MRRPRNCPYCGCQIAGDSRTCREHRFLPRLDGEAELRRLVADEDARIERAILAAQR